MLPQARFIVAFACAFLKKPYCMTFHIVWSYPRFLWSYLSASRWRSFYHVIFNNVIFQATTYDWKGLMIRVSPTSTCVQFFRKYILWHNWYKVVVLQKCKKLWRITFYNWRSYYSENKFENWLRKNILEWDCVT